MRSAVRWAGILAVAVLSTAAAQAQTSGSIPKVDSSGGPGVGQIAPDFALPGATRYGLLRNPVRLSDYRGQTVVLAFFYQARTKG